MLRTAHSCITGELIADKGFLDFGSGLDPEVCFGLRFLELTRVLVSLSLVTLRGQGR